MTHSHSQCADDIISRRRAPELCTRQRGSHSALWIQSRRAAEWGTGGGGLRWWWLEGAGEPAWKPQWSETLSKPSCGCACLARRYTNQRVASLFVSTQIVAPRLAPWKTRSQLAGARQRAVTPNRFFCLVIPDLFVWKKTLKKCEFLTLTRAQLQT